MYHELSSRCEVRRPRGAVITPLLVALAMLFSRCANGAGFTESQVKALFLMKFAQYVDWPEGAMAVTNAPIVIGVVGGDGVGDELAKLTRGKTAAGHTYVVKHLAADADPGGCQILYISDGAAPDMGKILGKAAGYPILTVGENSAFAENDGMINFVRKQESVHLEINLASARKAGLKISSKLLSVADVVKGR